MNKFNRWLRSKNGIATIAGILLLILVVAFAGDRLGWWVIIPRPGTAQAYFPPPSDGQTCLPTDSTTDGKFLAQPGRDQASFNGSPVVVWISVPGQYTEFTIKIFDGDSMLDNNGNLNRSRGNWDEVGSESIYTLYADPYKSGATSVKIGEYRGNQLKMPNNGWYEIKLPVDASAQPYEGGHYFYRLESRLENPGPGTNAFKLCSDGYLNTGQSDNFFPDKNNAQIGMIGAFTNVQDSFILYPNWQGTQPGDSLYTGEWYFTFPIDKHQDYFEFWNGDFDRGTPKITVDDDTDDPNTPGGVKPFFTTLNPELYSGVRPEDAWDVGNPADNFVGFAQSYIYLRNPAVIIQILDPNRNVICEDNNPSGSEEWEKFSMTSDLSKYPDADCSVSELVPGTYTLVIKGLDMHNAFWLRLPVCDLVDGCGPSITEGTCPRTIGYWKNNVNKVLIQGKTNGVQETPTSLDKALKFVAANSPLYRTGIVLDRPAAIADPGVRLTDQEADTILQRKTSTTMLSRALQQNLATWLNLASGKIGGNTYIELSLDEGATYIFEGTVWDALQEAQAIILNPNATEAELEHAKNIGDLINNGLLGEDAAGSSCDDYVEVIPPDKQKPREDFEKPNNPKEQPPVTPDTTPPDTTVCTTGNTYTIENTTTNPFYSVKFNAAAGQEINNGLSETFQYGLPKSVVEAMQTMQIEVKAATNSEIFTFACDFAGGIPCGPYTSADGAYSVSFMGWMESGDNYILNFMITVNNKFALSHVAFELPAGQTAIDPKVGCTTP